MIIEAADQFSIADDDKQVMNDITGGAELPLESLGKMNVNEFSRDRYNGSIIPLHGTISRPESIVFFSAIF